MGSIGVDDIRIKITLSNTLPKKKEIKTHKAEHVLALNPSSHELSAGDSSLRALSVSSVRSFCQHCFSHICMCALF